MNKTIVVGADTETIDPLMKTCGYSWKYNKGCILDTSLYYEETDEVKVIAGLYNQNCPYSTEERQKANDEVIALLKNPDVLIVGANLMYDIGWWLYEYKMTVFEVKCRFFDVLSAESVIDEYSNTNLDKLSYKYLKYGKTKDNVEAWVRENVSAKGDFRQYLKEVPYELLCEYAKGDAKNPVHIMRKQHTILRQEGLLERAKLDMDCILPILQITINGFPFDFEQKEKNLHILTKARNALAEDFKERYGKSLNVNSSQQVADFLEEQNIPFKYKITLKGYKGKLFENYEEIDSACRRAKKLVSSFRFVKRVPVAYVPCEMKDRTCDLLNEEGFIFNCSPNIDKSFYKTMREQHEIVGTLADWKSANGIISKILGDKYNQYVAHDLDGTDRIHAEYHINKSEGAGTISSRLSSTKPNNQQIPSKNGLKLKDGTELSFPALTRALFHSEKGAVLFKIDYSQIEYRLIVNYAIGEGAEEARALFNKDKHTDFHQYVVELTGLSRKYAKNMSFGISYGMSVPSMAENFGWTQEKAQEIADQYNEHMPFVHPTLALVGDVAKERGYIKTVLGNKARLRNPNLSYTMLNRLTQGSSADILKASIRRAFIEGVWEDLKIHVTVHDELDGSVYPTEEQVKRVIQLENIMETTVPLKIPLLAEAEFGMNWNDVKEAKEWLELKEKGDEEWLNAPEELKTVVELYAKLKQ